MIHLGVSMNYNNSAYAVHIQCQEPECLNVFYVAQGSSAPYTTRDKLPVYCPMCGSNKTNLIENNIFMWDSFGDNFKIPGAQIRKIFELWCDLAYPNGDESPNFTRFLKEKLKAIHND